MTPFRCRLAFEPHPYLFTVLANQAEIVGLLRSSSADPLVDIEIADAVFAGGGFPGTAETFDRAPRLKVVARFGAGYETIDLDAATERGICVTNTPDAPTISTAEFTIGLMLAVSHRLLDGNRVMVSGGWAEPGQVTGHDLYGKTLGIVGFGRIGRRVATLAAAFGMYVLAYDPFLSPVEMQAAGVQPVVSLNSLLASADVVTLHILFMTATTRFIGTTEIGTMKPGAILINASRGGVVDDGALVDALVSGHLAGAGIDVWSPEPTAADHPLRNMPNVVATPHQAALTAEGRARSNAEAARQVLMVLRNERPTHLLNHAVWDRRRSVKEFVHG